MKWKIMWGKYDNKMFTFNLHNTYTKKIKLKKRACIIVIRVLIERTDIDFIKDSGRVNAYKRK